MGDQSYDPVFQRQHLNSCIGLRDHHLCDTVTTKSRAVHIQPLLLSLQHYDLGVSSYVLIDNLPCFVGLVHIFVLVQLGYRRSQYSLESGVRRHSILVRLIHVSVALLR